MGNCVSCLHPKEEKMALKEEKSPSATAEKVELREETSPSTTERADNPATSNPERHSEPENQPVNEINAKLFTYQDLEDATQTFFFENFLGEGSFGKVYKGTLKNPDQAVAVKQLKLNGSLGDEEFLRELSVLSKLRHSNLVNLIGYYSDGDQRLLVYEYMIWRSLDHYLLNPPPGWRPMSWYRRMQIALDVALGLQYLHEKVNPPMIYRELKCSNILLGKKFNAKLSDIGLAKLCPIGDNLTASSKVMGTYGYCAPEYLHTGEPSIEPEHAHTSELSTKSDVYSFGVLMLELITGRKAVNNTKSPEEQGVVEWARPMLTDKQRYKELVDPRLKEQYPEKGLIQAARIARMCVKEDPKARPKMEYVVLALRHLTEPPDEETHSQEHIEKKEPKTYDVSKSRRTIRSGLQIEKQAHG